MNRPSRAGEGGAARRSREARLVRSYREGGKVKQEVLVHLGRYETPEDALAAWPSEVRHLRAIGRDHQADRLEANLKKLTALIEEEKRKE